MGKDFKPGDRVVRAEGSGPQGTVRVVREERATESIKESSEGKEKLGITVTVLWDNGTSSHFVPEALNKL